MEEEVKNNNSISGWQVVLNAFLFFGAIFLLFFIFLNQKGLDKNNQFIQKNNQNKISASVENDLDEINLLNEILPQEGVVLPVKWGDLGKRMIEAGVIDAQKFEALYANRGGLDAETKSLLFGENNGQLTINDKNNGVILNLLWAFGLSNKNRILEFGPMTDPNYGGPQVFASTGGWTLARDNPMNHYSKHNFVVLDTAQQELVERVSKNIYRPCCNNSTYFPDCNHGMAMLGLLELLASQGVAEKDMYKIALQVNTYWFPETYLTISKYFKAKGLKWENLNPQEILGPNFSSVSGYRKVLSEIQPVQIKSGGSCGV